MLATSNGRIFIFVFPFDPRDVQCGSVLYIHLPDMLRVGLSFVHKIQLLTERRGFDKTPKIFADEEQFGAAELGRLGSQANT